MCVHLTACAITTTLTVDRMYRVALGNAAHHFVLKADVSVKARLFGR
jgi:hypothetical protein